MREDVKDVLEKYRKKLGKRIKFDNYKPGPVVSREYKLFRKETTTGKRTFYEDLCNFSEKIIKVNPNEKDKLKLKRSIDSAHININLGGSTSLAVLVVFSFIILAIFVALFSFVILGELKLLLPLFLIIIGVVLLKPLSNSPNYIASKWRLKVSNQMVLCILYIVMYMRHTSNLEHALKFSTDHIGGPLALDLRKVFWNIETGKYSTIKESLDHYLETWRTYNLEFVEAFHLIESSLYEPTEARRVTLLEKSLGVILDGTYEKMLHYAHDLKTPITMLHMFGIVLPILGLVMFPLVGSFMEGIRWWHLALLYNIILPIAVFYIGTNILSKRPTGYGESEITELIPGYNKLRGKGTFSIILGVSILLIGFLPLLLHAVNPGFDFEFGMFGKFLGYNDGVGPFGIGALAFSFFVPLGIALGVGTYYKQRTGKLIKVRDATKVLEKEFASSLFQLGNRIGDGIPAEVAFGRIAKTLKGTPTGEFFERVHINLSKLGMSLKEAIFNKKAGAMLLFPSSLIESSMKVLLESAKKGPKVVSKSLISISAYVNRIHTVNERLKDLLAEVISSMKSQIGFLTPIIAGIVVGLASMIVTVIGKLSGLFSSFAVEESAQFNVGAIVEIFKIQEVIPSFYFQLIVGVYVVQVVILLTILYNGVENGPDKLNEQHLIGKNLYRSVPLYIVIAFIVTLLFNILAAGIIGGIQQI